MPFKTALIKGLAISLILQWDNENMSDHIKHGIIHPGRVQ